MRFKNRVSTMNHNLLAISLTKALALKEVLESEFEALKVKDLNRFESLQPSKIDILSFLAKQDLNPPQEASPIAETPLPENLATLDKVLNLLDECKILHHRNEIFITRKLESIRSALKTIQSPSATASVDVYDRLGKIRSSRSRQNMGDA